MLGLSGTWRSIVGALSNHLLWKRIEDKVPSPDKINILQAIRIAVLAWNDEVKLTNIAKCFNHCRIRIPGQLTVAQEEAYAIKDEEDNLDQEVIQDLESQIQQFRYNDPMDIRTLLNYSDEAVVTYLPELDEVIQDHIPMEADNAAVEEDDSEALPPIPAAEAQQMIQALEIFWMQQANREDQIMRTLQQMKDKITAIRTRQKVQKDIQSYFDRV